MPECPSSAARVRANRANAQKSTGPRDASRTRLNALKHGFFSKEVVIEGESAREFAAFSRALLADLAPQGMLEELLADLVIASAWRLRRAHRLDSEFVDKGGEKKYFTLRDLILDLSQDDTWPDNQRKAAADLPTDPVERERVLRERNAMRPRPREIMHPMPFADQQADRITRHIVAAQRALSSAWRDLLRAQALRESRPDQEEPPSRQDAKETGEGAGAPHPGATTGASHPAEDTGEGAGAPHAQSASRSSEPTHPHTHTPDSCPPSLPSPESLSSLPASADAPAAKAADAPRRTPAARRNSHDRYDGSIPEDQWCSDESRPKTAREIERDLWQIIRNPPLPTPRPRSRDDDDEGPDFDFPAPARARGPKRRGGFFRPPPLSSKLRRVKLGEPDKPALPAPTPPPSDVRIWIF